MEKDGKDVQIYDDLIFGLQNMIAGENHCLVSYTLSKDQKYIQIAKEIRRFRSKLMYKFIQGKDQEYCLSKHLLASAMALKELSNRFSETKELELAKECIDEANLFENIFVELNQKGG